MPKFDFFECYSSTNYEVKSIITARYELFITTTFWRSQARLFIIKTQKNYAKLYKNDVFFWFSAGLLFDCIDHTEIIIEYFPQSLVYV